MEKFNWAKAIGFGVLIWAVMFAFISFLIGYEWYDFMISKVLVVIAAGLLSYLCIKNVKSTAFSEALEYGISWVAVGVVLDLIASTQFNSYLFGAWEYWVGYALILAVPLFSAELKEEKRVKVSHAQ